MTNTAGTKVCKVLERVNLMLAKEDSVWLDALSNAIRERTGAKVSRSEIVRAALSTLAELHRLESQSHGGLIPLTTCGSGQALSVAGILAVRRAASA